MNVKFYELPEIKRTTIINGALKQFARVGYKKASMHDIAVECGVSKSLLFHYFGSKRDFFAFVYRYSFDLISEKLRSFEYRQGDDIFEMMRRANGIKLEVFKSHPYLYQFAYQSYFEQDPDVQDIVREKNTAYLFESTPKVIENMDKSKLRVGIAPEKAIQIILWVSEGFLQNKLIKNDSNPDKLFSEFNDWMDLLKLCLYECR